MRTLTLTTTTLATLLTFTGCDLPITGGSGSGSSSSRPGAGQPAEVAASRAAAPDWAVASNVPTLASGTAVSLDPIAHSGPVRGGFLRCAFTTTYSGDRRRTLAARRGIDTSLPDTRASLSVGRHRQGLENPNNQRGGLAGLSLLDLDDGDEIRLHLSDHGIFRSKQYDTLTATYGGALPLKLSGTHSEAECALASPASVEAALAGALVEVDNALREAEALSAAPIDVASPELTSPQGLLEQHERAFNQAVALVGWHHPEVSARAARLTAAGEAWRQAIAAAAVAAGEGAPVEATVDGTTIRPEKMSCPRPWGYIRRGFRKDCVLEIVAEASADQPFPRVEIITSEGRVANGGLHHVPAGSSWLVQPSFGEPPAGASALLLEAYTQEWGGEPVLLRVWGGDGQEAALVSLREAKRR